MIAKADYIEGAAKTFAVLESFDTQRQKLNATQAAARAGITRAAARRHLLTLLHLGYLEADEGHYWLSPKVLRLSGSYLASAKLPKTVQPVLNRLSAMSGLAYSVAVRDENECVIVARSAGMDRERHLVAHGLHLGARLSMTATSTGRVLLASLRQDEWSRWRQGAVLQRYTAYTEMDWRKFEAVIEQVRQADYCLASQEHELGVQALAVPLRDLSGLTVAALNVVVSVKEWTGPKFLKSVLPYLQGAAHELQSVL